MQIKKKFLARAMASYVRSCRKRGFIVALLQSGLSAGVIFQYGFVNVYTL